MDAWPQREKYKVKQSHFSQIKWHDLRQIIIFLKSSIQVLELTMIIANLNLNSLRVKFTQQKEKLKIKIKIKN